MPKPLSVHFMGIGGSGISAVAQIAKNQGFEVTGCDLETGRNTFYLEKAGIPVTIGHDASHLKGVDVLAHTPAVFYQSLHHTEYLHAVKRKIAITWEEFMGKELQKDKYVIAVAGTHGKGTTGAMLARILEVANFDPTVEIGANLLDWNKQNFRVGNSKYFVCEADEYHDNFLVYKPNLILITSVEMDHPDYFADFSKVMAAFEKFVKNLTGDKILVLNKNDKGCIDLAKKIKVVGVRVIWVSGEYKGKLQLPGEHIRVDAKLAAETAKALGVKPKDITKGLEDFGGLERRFEYKGETEDGSKVYDDYAHHPTAVAVNIQAIKELFPKKKIWVVLEPHMYSRLAKLFDEFVVALKLADRAIITDVYSRRESEATTPSGKDLATAVGTLKATYVGGGNENVINFVKRNTDKGDVIVVMGAGNSYQIAEELVKV